MKQFPKISVALGLFVAAIGCVWMDPGVLGSWYGEPVINREEAKNVLARAVRLSLATCPANNTPGLYAIEALIPREINHLRYFKTSIENCAVVLLLVPCGGRIQVEARDQDQITTQLYLPALRACNPRPIPETPIE